MTPLTMLLQATQVEPLAEDAAATAEALSLIHI